MAKGVGVGVGVEIYYRFVGRPFQILGYKTPITHLREVLEGPSDGSIKYINPTPTPTPTPKQYISPNIKISKYQKI